MSEHSRQLLDALRVRLAHARRRVLGADLLFGLALTLGVLAAALGLGAALEAGLWMGTAARLLFYVAFLLAALGLVGAFVVRPLLVYFGVLPGLGDEALAARIGKRFPEVSDRLTNLLDLAGGRATDAPAPLLDGAVQALGRAIEPVPIERVEDTRPAKRTAPFAAVPLMGLALFGLFAPATFTGAVQRLFSPTETFAPPAPFSLVVAPGDTEIVRGTDLTVEVRARGRAVPREATLWLGRVGEERADRVRLLADSSGTFRHMVTNVRESVRYRVEAAPVETDWFTATVVARPTVQALSVTATPPRYTRLAPQRLAPNVGDVIGLPGTEVALSARIGGVAIDSARVVFDDGTSVRLDLDGEAATGSFRLRREGTYRLVLHGTNGFTNADPISYTLQLLSDAAPQIRLLEPGADVDLNEALQTRVAAQITDDFGFARLRLFWRADESGFEAEDAPDFAPIDLPIAEPRLLDQDVAYPWLLRSVAPGLAPGDVVEYYLQVWDNDAVAGYKSARTPTFTLRFPSLAEQYDQLDETGGDTEEGLEELRRDADETREQFEELRDELRRKQDADWEDRRQLDNLMERQQNLDEQIEQGAEQMQELLDQMRENDLVSEETLRQYEEMQRVMEEVATPELMEALQKLQEAMENLDLPQMMEAMEDFEFNEEQFRERIERALDLLEKLQAAQKLDEAAKRAEALAEQEEALREQTGTLQEQQENGDLSAEESQAEQDRLAEEQQRAQEEAAALEQLMKEVQEQLEGMKNAPQDAQEQMQEAAEQMQEMQEQMQENQQQLQQNQLQDAQEGQQQMQQQMQQMSQQMQSMQQQMSGQQQQVNLAGLRRVLDDVLTLSYEQESLRAETAGQRADSPTLRPSASQQVELSAGLATVSDSLRSLAREVPQMDVEIQKRAGEALREMGASVSELTERRVPQAAGHQKASMTSLNDLALLLSDLMDQMQNPSQGQGQGSPSMQQMMQQLQQMSGQQQQLNQQIQQMLNDRQGERLSQDQQGRMQQLRQQQEALRQQLEEMAQNPNLDSQGRSQLQRIAEEMEEAARRMQDGRIDRELRERQENILTRLLEARESINQRGKKRERKSQTGQDRPPDAPDALPEQDEIDRLRRDLIRALESGYAPDYQELIKRYFDLLQQRNSSGS
ncbi:MAG: DUF4175 family protein [Bacteroidota bacterium]